MGNPAEKTTKRPAQGNDTKPGVRNKRKMHGLLSAAVPPGEALTSMGNQPILMMFRWGRTGFDLGDAPEAACRGRFVGLVNHRTKK